MSSVVDICNVSLSQIGHKSDVVSIDPPDGGAYASHCARFYPIARDIVLEEHPWRFAIKRHTLTSPTGVTPPTQWEEVYTLPSDMIRPLSVLPDEYGDETKDRLDYEIEGDYLYCQEEDVILKYIARVTDATKWTPSAKQCVGWKLSELLAGVIVKGDAGLRQYCQKKYEGALLDAMGKNASASRTKPTHTPVWMSDR